MSLRIGTCSWKFPSWAGLVYTTPEGAPPPPDALPATPLFAPLQEGGPPPETRTPYLVEYARQYNTVEIDQWFWSLFGPAKLGLPQPDDVEAYRAAVSDDFRFTVKAPNSVTLTHFYEKGPGGTLRPNPHVLSAELFTTFMELLAPLYPVLGPVFFQFEYLNRQKMATQARFLAQLGAFLREVEPQRREIEIPYGLEVRNPHYLNAAYFDFLAAHDLVPVLIQGYWMDDLREVYAQWRERILAHETVVLRLMGPDRQAIEALAPDGWGRIVLPKDDELPGIVAIIDDLLAHDVEVYVNVNNHYEGSSPLTIEKIKNVRMENQRMSEGARRR
jgi:uncharacterized protein YecE (DUF72 family)